MPHKYIVGYKTIQLKDTYTLIGLCFEDVAGGAMPMNSAFPFAEGMTKNANMDSADMLQVMGNDGQYTNYFLSNGRYGKNGASYNADLDGKWLKTAGTACADTINAGQAVWYVSRAAKETPHNLTVAGSVLRTSETAPKACTDTYTLIGNPYAVEVPINGGMIATGATKNVNMDTADMIQVMGEDGSYSNYFLSNGRYGKNGASYNADLDGKWLKTAGTDCTDTIPVGSALWYVARGADASVKLVNPLEAE